MANAQLPTIVQVNNTMIRDMVAISRPTHIKASNGISKVPVPEANTLTLYRTLPLSIQKQTLDYPCQMREAFLEYAKTCDPKSAIESLVSGAPEFLLLTNSHMYKDSPLGVSLLKKNPEASRFLVKLARQSSMAQPVLSHRNSAGHTLLMLAVDLNSHECADILTDLLEHNLYQIYQLYDSEGRNVFHSCTADGFAVSFRIILDAVVKLSEVQEISKRNIKSALDITDRQQKTPIHYMAEFGDIEMFNVLDTFARSKSVEVDYDARFLTSHSKTPLMAAAECGNYDACKWLLEKANVDVSKKQQATCLTALHLAVKLGNPDIIRLLRTHGAMSDYFDDECEDLDDYLTPLQVAENSDIPNKDKCLDCLRIDVEQLKKGYAYSTTPSQDPAEFLSSRKGKVVLDLQLFGSEQRVRLSQDLARVGRADQFVETLINYVPELRTDFNIMYLKKSIDPVFTVIDLLAETELASRYVIKQVLLDIGAQHLVELVIPATTS